MIPRVPKGIRCHPREVKNLIAAVDEDFAQIDRLLRELRERVSRAAEAVHVVTEKAAKKATEKAAPRKPRRRVTR